MMKVRKICVDSLQWVRNSVCTNPVFTFSTNSPSIDIVCVYDTCVDVQIIGEEDLTLYVTVTCDDSCVGKRSFTQVISLCNANNDCPDCSDCVDNVCISSCKDGEQCNHYTKNCEPCSKDNCFCTSDFECPCNQKCLNGVCTCSVGTYENHRGCCVSCLKNTDCPPCYTCINGECVLKCGPYLCNPYTEQCVECINSGDCVQEGYCCHDGKCILCPTYDCDCKNDLDCGACSVCIDCKCYSYNCPGDKICYQDECVNLCVDNKCPLGETPITYNGNCICVSCVNKTCTNNYDCNFPNCVCHQGECIPNPCYTTGLICPEGCGKIDGNCVPCNTVSCSDCFITEECQCLDPNWGCEYTGCSGDCIDNCGQGCGCYKEECFNCLNLTCQECAVATNCRCVEELCQYDPEYGNCDKFEVAIEYDKTTEYHIITATPNFPTPGTSYQWIVDIPVQQYFVLTNPDKTFSKLFIKKTTQKPIDINIIVSETPLGDCVKNYFLVIPTDCEDFENIIKNSITLCS